MPKIDIDTIEAQTECSYPPPFNEIARGRSRKRMGDAGGLDQFGVNLCTLTPGAASSQRHWHKNQDEFVFVLSGDVVLIEDEGETRLGPGDAATFKAGVKNGHQIVNRGTSDATLLEIGTRTPTETGYYSDIDMKIVEDEEGERFLHKDGAPY